MKTRCDVVGTLAISEDKSQKVHEVKDQKFITMYSCKIKL